ncbi:hypothetical protein N1030_01605 [Desulfovibrio mangrovi]|uniref:hypothetical protein n=1 Tax=Desulfovibrio mangrovi TaxID=2976983 RepID=UPI002247A8BC|nr:hypothetical protein [Desulfovibrio mangrovi]UZP67690.1 hypothetical protein N1030_01605 [Desulfovibrio mangrovi]
MGSLHKLPPKSADVPQTCREIARHLGSFGAGMDHALQEGLAALSPHRLRNYAQSCEMLSLLFVARAEELEAQHKAKACTIQEGAA